MSKFSEYIDSLEGKDELDPQNREDLHDIYNQDISTREAKIEELNGTVAEKDSAIADAALANQSWKAKNFDLAMQIPGNPAHVDSVITEPETDPSTVTIDDLFVKE